MRPARSALYRRCREFVEVETGRGSATAKLTTNPNVAAQIDLRKAIRYSRRPRHWRDILYKSGINFSIGKKGTRSLIYLGTGKDALMVHESAHAAYERVRTRAKLRGTRLADEVFASSLQLEWMMRENEKDYEKRMNAKDKPTWVIITNILEGKYNRNRRWGWSKAGFAVAKLIQKKFSEEERKQIREKLLNGKYTEFEIYGYFAGLLSEKRKPTTKE